MNSGKEFAFALSFFVMVISAGIFLGCLLAGTVQGDIHMYDQVASPALMITVIWFVVFIAASNSIHS